MRIFKNQWFARFADLGGGVYKQRLVRSGRGKSVGYRAIIFFKSGERAFFVYGFAKSDRNNINDKELRKLKAEAKDSFALTEAQTEAMLKLGTIKEIE